MTGQRKVRVYAHALMRVNCLSRIRCTYKEMVVREVIGRHCMWMDELANLKRFMDYPVVHVDASYDSDIRESARKVTIGWTKRRSGRCGRRHL